MARTMCAASAAPASRNLKCADALREYTGRTDYDDEDECPAYGNRGEEPWTGAGSRGGTWAVLYGGNGIGVRHDCCALALLQQLGI